MSFRWLIEIDAQIQYNFGVTKILVACALLITFVSVGGFAKTNSAPRCAIAIDRINLPIQEFELNDGRYFPWMSIIGSKVINLKLWSWRGILERTNLLVRTEFEKEINIELGEGVLPSEMISRIYRRFSKRNSLKGDKVHVRSAKGTREFPARKHPTDNITITRSVQKQRVFQVHIDGQPIPVYVRYEKTYVGRQLNEKKRTNKQLTIKAYLKSKDGFDRRLKTKFHLQGKVPSVQNINWIVSYWMNLMGWRPGGEMTLEHHSRKISQRAAIDLYLGELKIGFVSVDIKAPDKPTEPTKSEPLTVEIELLQKLSQADMAKVRAFAKELESLRLP